MQKKLITKHITHITAYYPPHVGGMENAAHAIAEGFAKKGYKISVLTSTVGVTHPLKSQKNLMITYLKSVELAHTPLMFSLFFTLLRSPKGSLFHVHIAHAVTPEIVFFVSKLRRIPYIAHIHLDVDPSGPFGFLLRPYKKIFLTYVLRNADHIICLSESQKQQMLEKYTLSAEKMSVIPNGVTETFFIDRTKKKEKEAIPHILFVGRLASQKRVPLLLDAVSQMKNKVIVDIVGDGEDWEKVKKIVEEKQLDSVILHGIKKDSELLSLYKQASLFVLPSEKEGISLSLLEAMAAGLPVVAFRVPGVIDLLSDCGILVNSQTPNALAQKLDETIVNGLLLKETSKKVQKKAKGYSWDMVLKNMEEIYKEVLSSD